MPFLAVGVESLVVLKDEATEIEKGRSRLSHVQLLACLLGLGSDDMDRLHSAVPASADVDCKILSEGGLERDSSPNIVCRLHPRLDIKRSFSSGKFIFL